MPSLSDTSAAISSHALTAAPYPFDAESVLLGLAALAFVVLMVLEVWRPYKRFAGRIARASFLTNTTAFMFNNIILSALSASSLFVVAEHFGRYGLLSGMPDGLGRWLLSFAIFDFAVYVWHYAGHRFEWMWRFHKVHHSDKAFNVTTGFRFHVLDLFLELAFKCVVTVLIGVQAKVVLICELGRMIFVLFHHANVSFKGEGLLSHIIITPNLHRVHHSRLRSEHDSNYGIVLSVWDRLFGTRKELTPERIGLDMIEADNFLQLFCLAFITERKFSRLLQMLPRSPK